MGNSLEIFDITEYYKKDERGWNIAPLVSEFPGIDRCGHVHIVSLVPNAVRGNHVHMTTDEWIVFWGADVVFVWQEGESTQEKKLDGNKAYLQSRVSLACAKVFRDTFPLIPM